MKKEHLNPSAGSRRQFIKSAGTAALAGPLMMTLPFGAQAQQPLNTKTLKVALIGCGGRGTGAANQALAADGNVVLTVMADIFEEHLKKSLENLTKLHPGKVKVDKSKQLIGFDAWKKAIQSDVDVVILATPPCFRPDHLMAAVEAGKHIFCEKPMAVDAPGIRKVLEAARKAKEKNLSLVSGFCWRYHLPKRATFGKVLDGAVGDITTIYNTYNTGELWSRPWQPGWSTMEKQMRNWLYYNWLSGDHIAEQAVHSLDMMAWALGDQVPVRVVGTGGRQVRTEELYGHVYDHFAVVYEYANGAKGFHFSRQQKNCANSYMVEVMGTKGNCVVDCIKNVHRISGEEKWAYRGEENDMYQTEHNELFASIRNGKPMNDGEWMANSTMLAIIGRMAAYTGQSITWEEAMQSNEVLGPKIDEYNWKLEYPLATVAKPGFTSFF
jgi:predicted dehydrogenase